MKAKNYTKLAEQGMMLTSNRPTIFDGKNAVSKDIGKFQNMDYDAKMMSFIATITVS